MASGGSCLYYSPCRNIPLIDPIEYELARDPGLVGDPHSGTTSAALSCNPTPDPNLIPALISAPVPALSSTPVLTNKLFKQFMKAHLESNQEPKQPPMERKRHLKAKVFVEHYGKLHMDCYYFCQQYKNHWNCWGYRSQPDFFCRFFSLWKH